jgi:hypothetical protein
MRVGFEGAVPEEVFVVCRDDEDEEEKGGGGSLSLVEPLVPVVVSRIQPTHSGAEEKRVDEMEGDDKGLEDFIREGGDVNETELAEGDEDSDDEAMKKLNALESIVIPSTNQETFTESSALAERGEITGQNEEYELEQDQEQEQGQQDVIKSQETESSRNIEEDETVNLMNILQKRLESLRAKPE